MKSFVLDIEELIKGYIAYKDNVNISNVDVIDYKWDIVNSRLTIVKGEYHVKN